MITMYEFRLILSIKLYVNANKCVYEENIRLSHGICTQIIV